MESKEKVEIIKLAIKQLMEDEDTNPPTSSPPPSSPNTYSVAAEDDNSGRRHLLTKLMSQLESLEGDEEYPNESEKEAYTSGIISIEDKAAEPLEMEERDKVSNEASKSNNEEIVKELKNVKRQNLITHCLLSAMIVLTLAWQLSEVSLILKIKDGLSNPFKSMGGIFKGFLKGNRQANIQDAMNHISAKQKDQMVVEPTYLPGLKIPELPHWDLPGLESSDED